jgi:hypothetical protein
MKKIAQTFYAVMSLILISMVLTGCGKEPEPISHNTLEDARQTARANAEFNAIQYRAENPRMDGLKIVAHGDTTQNYDCPQGSGWATLSIMNVDKAANTQEKYKVVCSTVSSAIGCFLEKDFEKTPHAKEANQCNTRLPFPLPKLAK